MYEHASHQREALENLLLANNIPVVTQYDMINHIDISLNGLVIP